jgi:hypothetical protein
MEIQNTKDFFSIHVFVQSDFKLSIQLVWFYVIIITRLAIYCPTFNFISENKKKILFTVFCNFFWHKIFFFFRCLKEEKIVVICVLVFSLSFSISWSMGKKWFFLSWQLIIRSSFKNYYLLLNTNYNYFFFFQISEGTTCRRIGDDGYFICMTEISCMWTKVIPCFLNLPIYIIHIKPCFKKIHWLWLLKTSNLTMMHTLYNILKAKYFPFYLNKKKKCL